MEQIQQDIRRADHEFVIDENHLGRIDKILSILLKDLSRARIQGLIHDGQVTLNQNICKSISKKVQSGDVVRIKIPAPKPWYPQAQNIPLDIVYEDSDLIVINKQAGLVVHPGAGNKDGTLVNALLHHCGDDLSGIGGVLRPGIVHRLDKDTTGLMVVAKNDKAHSGLASQFAERTLSRRYKTLVLGAPMPPKGKVDASIGRHPNHRIKMAAKVMNGKPARTYYTVFKNFSKTEQEPAILNSKNMTQKRKYMQGACSLVECKLESGRTHQIRVHMSYIGHPVIGDALYSAQRTATSSLMRKNGYDEDIAKDVLDFPRQMLHAFALSFIHPVSGETQYFETELPRDMAELIKKLEQ